MTRKLLIAALCVIGFAASNVMALSINFGDAIPWSDLDGLASGTETVDGVDVTLTAYNPIFPGHLEWSDGEGFGVEHCIDINGEEIEGPEKITLLFSTEILLTELSFEDLYCGEEGEYTIDGVTTSFVGNSSTGSLTLALNNVRASSIVFSVPGFYNICDSYILHDVTGSEVPEPASMLLLSSSLLGLGALRRRKI